MAEKVIVRQNNNFEIEFRALDPHDPEADELQQVEQIYEFTPYTMLLASLGACTAIVLHTYAQHHKVALEEVELQLSYERVFQQDCENCEEIDSYDKAIDQELTLTGQLSEKERKKLFQISQQCSVHKMLEAGIEIHSRLSDKGEQP